MQRRRRFAVQISFGERIISDIAQEMVELLVLHEGLVPFSNETSLLAESENSAGTQEPCHDRWGKQIEQEPWAHESQ